RQRRERRGSQQRPPVGQLVVDQRRCRSREFGELVLLAFADRALHAAHDFEAALEAVDDQVVLRFVMMVERALRDVQARGDLLDRSSAVTLLVDQARRRDQESLARRQLLRGRLQHRVQRQRLRLPDAARRRQPVHEDVVHALANAVVVFQVVARQPGDGPEDLLRQDLRARSARLRVEPCELGRDEDLADLREEAHVRLQHDTTLRLLQRADVVEHSDRRRFARGDSPPQVEPRFEQTLHACVRPISAQRVAGERVESLDAVQEAGDGEIFFLLEVVGDAGRDEPDAARDAGERHPLHAVVIEDVARGSDDRLLLPCVARRRGAARGSFGRRHVADQKISNSPAAPMPPPTHIVTTPYFAPRRLPSISRWPVMRAPDMPYGWPIEIAPPETLSLSFGMPSLSRMYSTWLANASFSSQMPMSSIDRPLALRSFGTANTGPMPISSGSHAATIMPRYAPSGLSPRFSASFASISTEADAPSESCEALPAVMKRPSLMRWPFLNTGCNACRSASVVLGRLPSSSLSVTSFSEVAPVSLSVMVIIDVSGASSAS